MDVTEKEITDEHLITPATIAKLNKLFDLSRRVETDEDFLELVKDFDEDE